MGVRYIVPLLLTAINTSYMVGAKDWLHWFYFALAVFCVSLFWREIRR